MEAETEVEADFEEEAAMELLEVAAEAERMRKLSPTMVAMVLILCMY
jgi:hypothetical protein